MSINTLNNTLSKKLTKISAAILLASSAGAVMAANPVVTTSGSAVEKTGAVLTNISDNMYKTLTGKSFSTVEVNHPVSLYDYTEASTSYEDAYLNGALNVRDSKDADTSYDLNMGIDYEKAVSSPDTSIKYKAQLNGAVSDDGSSAGRQENYAGLASATYDKYFNPAASDAFWYGKGQVRIQEEEPEDYAGLSNPEVILSGGLGYGRVVNVTPMAQAMRLVEALVENGTLRQIPSADTYRNVASIIDKKQEYSKRYPSNYTQYWIRDIEQALGQPLNAAGTIRAYEVLENESISTRKYGWDVRAGLGVVANNFAGNSGNPLLELGANYYYPVSNQTQFSNEARLTAELDDDDNSYKLSNKMGLTYELSDRVDWNNSWQLDYENNENSENVLRNTVASEFAYEISNSVDYTTKLSLAHVDYEDSDSKFDKSLFMGVKYRLK